MTIAGLMAKNIQTPYDNVLKYPIHFLKYRLQIKSSIGNKLVNLLLVHAEIFSHSTFLQQLSTMSR